MRPSMLSRSIEVTFIAVLIAGLAGCRSLSEKLGIPVEIRGENNDPCRFEQHDAFDKEFGSLSRAQKGSLRLKMQSKYKSLIFEPSEITQTISGSVIFLKLMERDCSGSSCTDRRLVSKRLTSVDQLEIVGDPPVTQVHEDASLWVRMQLTLDESIRLTYKTYDIEAYDIIESNDDPDFLLMRQRGLVTLIDEDAQPTPICSDPVSLVEIVGGL